MIPLWFEITVLSLMLLILFFLAVITTQLHDLNLRGDSLQISLDRAASLLEWTH